MPSFAKKKARLVGHVEEGSVIEAQDLRSANALGSLWKDCRFVRCKMDLAIFATATFERCVFDTCSMNLAAFGKATLRECSFLDCDMEQAGFGYSNLDRVTFSDCRLALSSFEGANLRTVSFCGSNLHRADLRYYIGSGVSYEHCNLWSASVQLGCSFFEGTFDERSCQQFTAMVGRRWPDEKSKRILLDLAGPQAAVVERLMSSEEET